MKNPERFLEQATRYITTLNEIASDMRELAAACEAEGDAMTQMRFEAAGILATKSADGIEGLMEQLQPAEAAQ